MLSAEELFKVRHGLDKSIPDKGGNKDFMPQGTWLENKRLEKIHEEREQILSEPRILRKCDWVKGTWVPEKQLVELVHEMRNFWQYMGFLNSQQKLLYPEEALFLMEINVLQVWYKGVSLSIQEAYTRMLGGKMNLEMFQVYSHLRRIGYVVLRHRGRLDTTEYERKIGLDKVSKLAKNKKRDRKRKKGGEASGKTENGEDLSEDCKKQKTESDNATKDSTLTDTACDSMSECKKNLSAYEIHRHLDPYCAQPLGRELTDSNLLGIKREADDNNKDDNEKSDKESNSTQNNTLSVQIENGPNAADCQKMAHRNHKENNQDKATSNSDCLKDAIDMKGDNLFINTKSRENYNSLIGADRDVKKTETKRSVWDFTEIVFPDFGIQNESVVIEAPSKIKLLENFEFSSTSYTFHRKEWINKKKDRKKNIDEDIGRLSETLEFSYADYMGGNFSVKEECKTWAEYKDKLQDSMQGAGPEKVVPHLYEGGVSPLVQPQKATCTRSVLEQLSIVKEEVPEKRLTKPDILPDYDVYMPNDKFKKSLPGTPDLRICVTKGEGSPPDLAVISQITGYLQDSVPLHWAVVDSGDIAFFSLKDFILPTDISLG